MRSSLLVRLLWILTDLHGNNAVGHSNCGGHLLWLHRRLVIHGNQRGERAQTSPRLPDRTVKTCRTRRMSRLHLVRSWNLRSIFCTVRRSSQTSRGTRLRQVSRRPRYCHAANRTNAQQHLSVWEHVTRAAPIPVRRGSRPILSRRRTARGQIGLSSRVRPAGEN